MSSLYIFIPSFVIFYLSGLSRKLFLKRIYHNVNFLAFCYLYSNLQKKLFLVIL